MKHGVRKIIEPFKDKRGILITMLQQLQNRYGYLSQEVIFALADELKLSEHEIYGVATFYTQFKFVKPAAHQIKVCLGTACHVRGGANIMETIERALGIKYGQLTADGKFGLERVACMGCCALAPVIVIDGNVHGKTTQTRLIKTLKELLGVKDD